MKTELAAWGRSLDEFVRVSRHAERAGFTRVWSSELHRSPFVPLAAVAAATTDIGIGTGIALAFVRSPLATAIAALDLDEMSGGRLTLGLGSGVRGLVERHHGASFEHPVERMRDTIDIVRDVVARSHTGESVTHVGSERSVDLVGFERPYAPERGRIPLHLAAVGPRMTELAGETADGWIGHELMSPEYLNDVVLPSLEAGLARSGRTRDDIEIVVSANCSVDPDASVSFARSAASVAFYASVKTYRSFFAFHGFGDEADIIRRRFREGDVAGMVDAVPREMVDAVAICGTVDEAAQKIARYEGVADAIKLGPPTYFQDHDAVHQSVKAIVHDLAPSM